MKRPTSLPAVLLAALLLVGCGSSGAPNDWAEQADATGRGLPERNFVDACMAANDDLSEAKSRSLCECILGEVQSSATYEDYRRLEDHFRNNADQVTESGLADLFPWFTDAVATCDT